MCKGFLKKHAYEIFTMVKQRELCGRGTSRITKKTFEFWIIALWEWEVEGDILFPKQRFDNFGKAQILYEVALIFLHLRY